MEYIKNKQFKWLIIGYILLTVSYIGILILKFQNPFITKFYFSAYVLLITLTALIFNVRFIEKFSLKNNLLIPSTSILTYLSRAIILIFGILFILQIFGVSITPLLTALGVGGVAIALALQDTLSNFFAGIYIIISKQINIQDYVKLENGNEGYIMDITWRNTSIRSLSNNLIIVPNSKLTSAIINNYSLPDKEIAVLMELGVSYDSDLKQVEKVTIETALETMRNIPGGHPTFIPLIRYHDFGEYAIQFTVVMRALEYTDQYLLKHEFIKNLHEKYKAENIESPFPVRLVKIENNK